jgi:hypothetical protein
LIDVGKAAGDHTMTQDEINAALIEHGRAGRRVVRLKGGDPYVFGRGGEEALALAAAGVPCTIVPGVTSVIGGLGLGGIPVTQRGVAASFAVVTGHEDPTKPAELVHWERLAAATDTLVVLMGVERLDGIAAIRETVRECIPAIREGQRTRLQSRLADLPVPVDPGRIEQELVLALQKLDVDEELDRLDAHLGEARRVLKLCEAVGRRLDFLLQEFNREANTLGSKSVDSRTSSAAIDLKVLIDQIREQVQNIE